jgi:hypothetical protein
LSELRDWLLLDVSPVLVIDLLDIGQVFLGTDLFYLKLQGIRHGN